MPRHRAHVRARALFAVVGAVTLLVAAGCGRPAEAPPSAPTTTPVVTPSPTTADPHAGCEFKPAGDNTGAAGDLRSDPTLVLENGQRLENVRVASLEIRGRSVVVRNVEVTGKVLVLGDNVLLDRVSAAGVAISSASGTRVQYTRIGNSLEDGIDVTSDRGRKAKNILLSHNFVATPKVGDDAHYDGTQVRGVDRLRIQCSTYDAGPWRPMYNAAVFLEDANGGNTRVSIERNWLYGSGFSLMIDSDGTRIIGNRIGGDTHWDTCLLGETTDPSSLVTRDNIDEDTGSAVKLCTAADRPEGR